jgi:hypothetical protein
MFVNFANLSKTWYTENNSNFQMPEKPRIFQTGWKLLSGNSTRCTGHIQNVKELPKQTSSLG